MLGDFQMIIALIVVLLALLILLLRHSNKKDLKRIDESFTCAGENFRISGHKNRFKIQKGERFEFLVVDGEIVSCIDKSISKSAVNYGGTNHGGV